MMEKQVLSIEQMQELKKLGIDTSKASMYWNTSVKTYIIDKDLIEGELCVKGVNYTYNSKHIIPTFTLQDILEKLPNTITNYTGCYILKIIFNKNMPIIKYENCNGELMEVKFFHNKSLLEAAFNMFKWCKQNNYI